MSSYFICIPKSFEFEVNVLPSFAIDEHPLKTTKLVSVVDKSKKAQFVPELDGFDPLSQLAAEAEFDTKSPIDEEIDSPNWSSKRLGILNRYCTSEKLSLTTSFLSGGETTIKSQTVVTDKVKHRLEQLDYFEEGSIKQWMNLSQQEYISRIEQLNNELVYSWKSEQRVKALKIAIQCSKMLADTSVLQFYPSAFVLITDILDIFSQLVYDRLKSKNADIHDKPSADNAKETTQNWFYKISSIRELLPRIYVEIALLRSYEFLSKGFLEDALQRLTLMIRGIADPLVATYLRAYLVRVGITIFKSKDFVKDNFSDVMEIYNMIFSSSIKSEVSRQKMAFGTYISLYEPALNWIVEVLTYKTTELCSLNLLNLCRDCSNSGLLLFSLLSSLKPQFIANNAIDFINTINDNETEGISKCQLIKILGICLSNFPPPPDDKQRVYKSVFSTVNMLKSPTDYIDCVDVWSKFLAENLKFNEVDKVLGEIILRMNQDKTYELHYTQLHSIIEKLIKNSKDLENLLCLDNFLLTLDLFHKESLKVDICKCVASNYKPNPEKVISDPVVTNTLLYVCKILNDSVNALTVDDEKKLIGDLISGFIKSVNYGKKFEEQLLFYVEARSVFPNLDSVLYTLIQCVNNLAIETRRIVNSNHTKKTAAFVKACAAYCVITIPSLTSISTQMELYLASGQVALLNICLGQSDACFESAINLISDLPTTNEADGTTKCSELFLVSYLSSLLSTLICVPDSPDQGVLYLVRLMLDVLKDYPFDENSTALSIIYFRTIDMLYSQSLDEFPYSIPNVVSNLDLYGRDKKFINEINAICSQIVEDILVMLKNYGDSGFLKMQCSVALELVVKLMQYSDLTEPTILQLVNNLWVLASKIKSQDPKVISKIYQSIEDLQKRCNNQKQKQRIGEFLSKFKM
ncbi:C16orf62 family protein [Megaselia abdita]